MKQIIPYNETVYIKSNLFLDNDIPSKITLVDLNIMLDQDLLDLTSFTIKVYEDDEDLYSNVLEFEVDNDGKCHITTECGYIVKIEPKVTSGDDL